MLMTNTNSASLTGRQGKLVLMTGTYLARLTSVIGRYSLGNLTSANGRYSLGNVDKKALGNGNKF